MKEKCMQDPYEVLGVPHNASEATIKSAFRNIAKRTHPDVNGGNELLTKKFREAAEAYEMLNDYDKRQAYDRAYNDAQNVQSFKNFYSDTQSSAMETEYEIHKMYEHLKFCKSEAIGSFLIGMACLVGGLAISYISYLIASHIGGRSVITIGLIFCGAVGAFKGFVNAILISSEMRKFKKKFWDEI